MEEEGIRKKILASRIFREENYFTESKKNRICLRATPEFLRFGFRGRIFRKIIAAERSFFGSFLSSAAKERNEQHITKQKNKNRNAELYRKLL